MRAVVRRRRWTSYSGCSTRASRASTRSGLRRCWRSPGCNQARYDDARDAVGLGRRLARRWAGRTEINDLAWVEAELCLWTGEPEQGSRPGGRVSGQRARAASAVPRLRADRAVGLQALADTAGARPTDGRRPCSQDAVRTPCPRVGRTRSLSLAHEDLLPALPVRAADEALVAHAAAEYGRALGRRSRRGLGETPRVLLRGGGLARRRGVLRPGVVR